MAAVNVKVERPITPEMAERIAKLILACATLDENGQRLIIMPGSETYGGKALENLTSELNLLLHGFKVPKKQQCPHIK